MDVRLYSAMFLFCSGFMAIVLGCADGTGAVVQNEDPFSALLRETDTSPTAKGHSRRELAVTPIAKDQTDIGTSLVSASTPPPTAALIELGQEESLHALVAGSPGPVLLDFFADWCGPCRTQGKILHDIEAIAANSGTLMIKINVDEHPDLAEQLGVNSLPTLMMVKNGQVVERRSGVTRPQRLAAWMQ